MDLFETTVRCFGSFQDRQVTGGLSVHYHDINLCESSVMILQCAESTSVDAMVNYLRQDVGITRKDHALLISTFAKHKVDEEGGAVEGKADSEDGASAERKARQRRITFCVEGNISVGKSTFLREIAGELLKLHHLVEVVPEPLDQWQNVDGSGRFNMLQAFYDDPQRNAYTFQNYVFITRVMQNWNTLLGKPPLRLVERSVFTDRMVGPNVQGIGLKQPESLVTRSSVVWSLAGLS